MSDRHSRSTYRPPSAEIIRVCVIDTDKNFCTLLREFLDDDAAGAQATVAVVERIPKPGEMEAAVVIFDPMLEACSQVDSIDSMQRTFGQDVILVARIREGVSEEFVEDLAASGVRVAVASNDLTGIALLLNELSLGGLTRSSADSGTSITPLRPQPVQITLSIIDADPTFSKHLSQFLNSKLPGLVMVDEVVEGIPDPDEVKLISRAVIFDPELDDFRRLAPAIAKLRQAFGEDTLLVAHTDVWNIESRLRSQLIEAGVRIGIKRADLMSFLKLIDLLTRQESVDVIVQELGC